MDDQIVAIKNEQGDTEIQPMSYRLNLMRAWRRLTKGQRIAYAKTMPHLFRMGTPYYYSAIDGKLVFHHGD